VTPSIAVQLCGSLLILIPFILVQANSLKTDSAQYSALNLAGSTILAADAWHGREWGFLLLEGTWAVVSLLSLRPKNGRAVNADD
jgi:hypothetical protein